MGNKWQGVRWTAQVKRHAHAELQVDNAASHRQEASCVHKKVCGEDALITAEAATESKE